MSGRMLVLLASVGLSCACGERGIETLPPRGQIVLYVTTDAPLPPEPGTLAGPDDPAPLFDTLRVEVYAPGETEPCGDGCTREVGAYAQRMQGNEASRQGNETSLGIVPAPGVSGYVARARLYRAITRRGGEPPQLSAIDVSAELPSVTQEGIVEATLVLRVEDVGSPVGSLEAPLPVGEASEAGSQLRMGKVDFDEIGLWPGAASVPCSGRAGSGEACVPGGAYWMGHPFVDVGIDGSDSGEARLVVLSPFYVDLHEVTVEDFRASGLATLADGTSIDPISGPVPATEPEEPGALTSASLEFFCSYSVEPSSRDEHALNCVSWTAASTFCAAQGKQLPSEAQFEYMASGLRSNLFLWGQTPASCGDAVWGRWGLGAFAYAELPPCRELGDLGGPKKPGTGKLDRLPLQEGDVVDLMGNETEWTRDVWNGRSEPCWAGQGFLEDPECGAVSPDGERRTVKGSAWSVEIYPAAYRISAPPDFRHPQTGFRCVRAAP